jgi:Domain of unknown function (DUF4389)
VLILGRMPQPVFEATAAVVRYTMRAQAYFMMLTSAYPKWLFGGRALLIVIIVLGVLGSIGENISSAVLQNRDVSNRQHTRPEPAGSHTPGLLTDAGLCDPCHRFRNTLRGAL